MSSILRERGAMRRHDLKRPGRPSPDARCDDDASVAVSDAHVAKPSWQWRVLLAIAVVSAALGAIVALAPGLFLPVLQAMAPHAHP